MSPRSDRWTLAALSLVMLMPSLDTGIANAGLPILAQAFAASFEQTQWIVVAYLLSVTTLIVSVGRFGDIVGRRKLLLNAITVFTLASAACGLAPSLSWLLAARAAQGVGAAGMMVLAIALARDSVATERTGRSMGRLGAMSAIGTALGPSLGGVLMTSLGWRSIFLINVPVGFLAYQLVRRHVATDPLDAFSRRHSLDIAGTVLLAITLGAYALSATVTPFAAANAILLLVSAFAGSAFYAVERRAPFPLLRVSGIRDRAFSNGLMMSALVSTVMMTTLVVGPFYLSRVFELDAMAAGLVLSAGPIVAAMAGPPAGRLVDTLGAQRVTAGGLMGIAAGAIALVIVPSTLGVPGYVAPIALMTAGYAAFQAANNTAIMAGVAADQRGAVAGLLSLSRNLGLMTGAAVMPAVFASSLGPNAPATAPPEAIVDGMRITFTIGAAMIGGALVAASHRVAGLPRANLR